MKKYQKSNDYITDKALIYKYNADCVLLFVLQQIKHKSLMFSRIKFLNKHQN